MAKLRWREKLEQIGPPHTMEASAACGYFNTLSIVKLQHFEPIWQWLKFSLSKVFVQSNFTLEENV